MDGDVPPISRVVWKPCYRIVSSRFPPVGLFDEVADPADLDALYKIESLTNPRLREASVALTAIPAARRVVGPGATPVMAAFTHINRAGSRFSDGTFGVYYAAATLHAAVAETVYHRERFMRSTRQPPTTREMRCYLADVTIKLHDVRRGYDEVHAPNSYVEGQALGRRLRAAGSNGIVYRSVRDIGGECLAAFYPDVIGHVHQGQCLLYRWDGHAITHAILATGTVPIATRGEDG